MAFESFYETDDNLFSKLSSSGYWWTRITVSTFPVLRNLTVIPVLMSMMRCNLLSSGAPPCVAATMSLGRPWVLSASLYVSPEAIEELFLGEAIRVLALVVNVIVPFAVFIL